MGISSEEKLMSDAVLQKFKPIVNITIQDYINKIKNLISEILNIKVSKRIKLSNKNVADILSSHNVFTLIGMPLDIDDSQKKSITDMATVLNVNLPGDFFDLGNLVQTPIYCGRIEGADKKRENLN